MPRKTDGIEFELHSSPQKDKDGKPLLYAKLASKKKITFEQLEGYSISHKHMAKGELEACFTKFLNGAALWFHEGYRVETPIGSFAPKLKQTGRFRLHQLTGRLLIQPICQHLPHGTRQAHHPPIP